MRTLKLVSNITALIKRLITILIILPVFLLVNVFFNKSIFILFSILVYILSFYEWKNLIKKYNDSQFPIVKFSFCIFLIFHLVCFDFVNKITCIISFTSWVMLNSMLLNFPENNKTWKNKHAYNLIELNVISIPFAYFIKLHSINYNLIISSCFIPLSFDIFAYLLGSMLGKKKFFYKISPNKTWEGATYGCVLMLFSTIFFKNMFCEFHFFTWKFILVLVVCSILGDLTESVYKRISKKKNSGNLLPGHGGVLDRIDSCLPVISVSYIAYTFEISDRYLFI